MKYPKLGKKYKALVDVNGFYYKGETYKSESEGCITDESGDKYHRWVDLPEDGGAEEAPQSKGGVYEFEKVFEELK